ncbi:MAG: Na+/H+ antiporter subunit E [Rhizobiaceae bacterium]|nr:Na+/H+ antiporter subunit E [Rhizobiaceae bacterium]
MLPFPVLTATLILFWLLLAGFSPGQFILGTLVAVFASWAMTALRPDVPKIRKWHLLFKLLGIVIVDIVRSNIAVASVILRRRSRRHTSDFLLMPLEVEDRTALTLLAIIVTSTPGSAWLEYDSRDRTVLLHVLDVIDKDMWMDVIRNRYEKVLLEIFE